MSVRGLRRARRAAVGAAVNETAGGAVGEAVGGPPDEAAGETIGGAGQGTPRDEGRAGVRSLARWWLLECLRGPQDPARRLLNLVTVWTLAGGNLLLSAVTAEASILYFAIYPLLWAVHRTRATGILATVVFSAGMAVAMTVRTGHWGSGLATGGVSCLFSTAIGLWLWHLYEISEALKESLAAEQVARQALARTQAELAAAEHAAGAALERERWAREVHDTLAQGFVSVVALSQAARSELSAGAPAAVASRLDQLEAVARDNLAEARSLVAGEGPSALRVGDLGQALARLVEAQHRDGRRAALSVDLPDGLPRTVEVVVLRTVQEALSNVTRHSGAQEVVVAVACQSAGGLTELVTTVVDDGVGAGDRPEGTGLTGMRSRVESLGGTLTVDPARAPGPQGRPGTVVEARMPL